MHTLEVIGIVPSLRMEDVYSSVRTIGSIRRQFRKLPKQFTELNPKMIAFDPNEVGMDDED